MGSAKQYCIALFQWIDARDNGAVFYKWEIKDGMIVSDRIGHKRIKLCIWINNKQAKSISNIYSLEYLGVIVGRLQITANGCV